jgi:hypothetical protein
MHGPYLTTPHRLPVQAMHAIFSPQIWTRVPLIAVQEERQLARRCCLVGARRFKIMRMEQSAVPPDPLTLPRSALQAAGSVSKRLAAAPHPRYRRASRNRRSWGAGSPAQRVDGRSVDQGMAGEAVRLRM